MEQCLEDHCPRLNRINCLNCVEVFVQSDALNQTLAAQEIAKSSDINDKPP